jgi:diguanylate cyclase (GGDEF)-like protein
VLQSISQEIQAQLRQYDSAARFGGEEFALLLPETNLSEGTMVAERLRQIISKIQFSDSISDLKITASIGIAAIPHKKINTTEDLIRLADDALYAAKSNGRNRVETVPPA